MKEKTIVITNVFKILLTKKPQEKSPDEKFQGQLPRTNARKQSKAQLAEDVERANG